MAFVCKCIFESLRQCVAMLMISNPCQARVYLKVRSGVITSCKISGLADEETSGDYEGMPQQLLVGKAVHEVADFNEVLKSPPDLKVLNAWLNRMFGLDVG